MAVSNDLIRELRERTGCGIQACRQALGESQDNLDKAIDYLRKKGLADASKKSGREAGSGSVFTYIHAGSKLGVLLELNCETDFVANTELFQELGKDLCMHICAAKPTAIKREDIPKEVIEREKEIYREQVKDKKDEVREKIVDGKLEKFYQDNVLLEQAFVKDDRKVEDVIKEKIGVLKENIVPRRFVRYQVGEKN